MTDRSSSACRRTTHRITANLKQLFSAVAPATVMLFLHRSAEAWTVRPHRVADGRLRSSVPSRTRLCYTNSPGGHADSSGNDKNGDSGHSPHERAMSERMVNIRALQKAFYSPSAVEASNTVLLESIDDEAYVDSSSRGTIRSADDARRSNGNTSRSGSAGRRIRGSCSSSKDNVPRLDDTTGILHNLPIWDASDIVLDSTSAAATHALADDENLDKVHVSHSDPTRTSVGPPASRHNHAVPWTSVPGRSHVVSVDSPINTHLLETIVRSNPEKSSWYVGHIPTEAGLPSSAFDSPVEDSHNNTLPTLGCLLRITDFRRMIDGQILVLIHVVDRFVVDSVQHRFPFPVANVQLIPDLEELDPFLTQEYLAKETESTMGCVRAMAIAESFSYYQDYEYDLSQTLPLPCGEDDEYATGLHPGAAFDSVNQVNLVMDGSVLAKAGESVRNDTEYDSDNGHSDHETPIGTEHSITDECYLEEDDLSSKMDRVLPFSPYAKNVRPPTTDEVSSMMLESGKFQDCEVARDFYVDDNGDNVDDGAGSSRKKFVQSSATSTKRPLEWELLKSNVLRTPTSVESSWAATSLSARELEIELWLAMNEYLGKTRTPVSPILLGLIPPNVRWPSNFKLNSIGRGLSNLESLLVSKNQPRTRRKITHDYVPMSTDYPDYRRQKRLSYCAAQLLEKSMTTSDEIDALRQRLLQIPATKHRLAYALNKFHTLLSEIADGTYKP